MPTEAKLYTGLFKWKDIKRWHKTWHVYLCMSFVFLVVHSISSCAPTRVNTEWVELTQEDLQSHSIFWRPGRLDKLVVRVSPVRLNKAGCWADGYVGVILVIFWVRSYNVRGQPAVFSVAEINIIPLGVRPPLFFLFCPHPSSTSFPSRFFMC